MMFMGLKNCMRSNNIGTPGKAVDLFIYRCIIIYRLPVLAVPGFLRG
jgi:hypothetical protein